MFISRDKLVEEVNAIYSECSSPDWDGYGAEPISEMSYRNTLKFVNLLFDELPDKLINVDPGADPDGACNLYFYSDQKNILSISISIDSKLDYAGFHKGEKFLGSECLVNEIPDDLLKRIVNYCQTN